MAISHIVGRAIASIATRIGATPGSRLGRDWPSGVAWANTGALYIGGSSTISVANAVTTVEWIQFATDTKGAAPTGLATAVTFASATASQSAGYAYGGQNAAAVKLTTGTKWTWAARVRTTLASGLLTATSNGSGATGDSVFGWACAGGSTGVVTAVVCQVLWATEIVSVVAGAAFTVGSIGHSTMHGLIDVNTYWGGGNSPPVGTKIEKTVTGTKITTAIAGVLPAARWRGCGVSDGLTVARYISGLDSVGVGKKTRYSVSLATEIVTTLTPVAVLPTDPSAQDSYSSNARAYIVGGRTTSPGVVASAFSAPWATGVWATLAALDASAGRTYMAHGSTSDSGH